MAYTQHDGLKEIGNEQARLLDQVEADTTAIAASAAAIDTDLDTVKTELQALNTKAVAPSDAVTASSSVAAAGQAETVVVTKGFEKLSIVAAGLGASLTVEVHLLDAADASVHVLQTITADGVTVLDVAWPKVKVIRKNGSAVAATITVHYAMR